MEQIELRSEKVRNLIGAIPPLLVRMGNSFIVVLLIVIIAIGNVIKIPITVRCDAQVLEQENTVQLAIISTSKFLTKPIEKGKHVKIYKNGVLLFSSTLNEKLDKIDISKDNFQVFVPIFLPNIITTKEQIKLLLKNNSHLEIEIEIDNQSVFEKVFGIFFIKKQKQ